MVKKPSVPIWVWSLAATPILVAFWRVAVANATTDDWLIRGAMGDAYGGHFGSMAALSSAILLFYAVWMQHQELSLQRKELADTRDEMRMAREVHEASRRELEAQTAIARKSAHYQLIFDAARAMRATPRPTFVDHPDNSYLENPDRSFISAQEYLADLLRNELIEPHERALLAQQFWLDLPHEKDGKRYPPVVRQENMDF